MAKKMDPAQIRIIWGREETRFRVETVPLGFKAGVQLGCGILWTGESKRAVTIVFYGEFAAILAAGPEAGDVSHLIRALGSSFYCLFFPVSFLRAAQPC